MGAVAVSAMRALDVVESAGAAGGRGGGAALDVSWGTVEGVVALFTADEGAARLLEFLHADGWEGGSAVVLGGVLVDLVHWDGGVHDVGLDGLLVDDGLRDMLVLRQFMFLVRPCHT